MIIYKRLLLLLLLVPFLSTAQETGSIMEYIDKYKDLAMAEMKRTGVPASIKLAQGIHETTAGTSPLVMKSNNHFGIKCKTGWSGPSVKHDDDARNECFRKYESAMDSYRDHSNFLKGSSRYASLFNLDPTDYEGWAWGLKKAGYATNPKYAQTIIKLIEEYGLQQYSLIAMGQKLPATEETREDAPVEEVQSAPVTTPASTTEVESKTGDDNKTKEVITKPIAAKTEELDAAEHSKKSEPGIETERYPAGIFKQQGRKAVFVSKGTPYLAVAQQYRLPLSKLFEFNNLLPSVEANSDQVVFLEKKSGLSLPLPNGLKKKP